MKTENNISLPSYRVLPLKDLVVFPSMVVPLIIGRKTSLEAIDAAMENEKLLFLVAQKDALKEDVGPADLFRFGVIGRILQLVRLPNGLVKILVEGVASGKVKRYMGKDTLMKATLNILEPVYENKDEDEAKKRQLVALFKEYIKLSNDIPEEILFSFNQLSEMSKITDFISTHLDISIEEKQGILQKLAVNDRVSTLLKLLKKENSILAIKSNLDDQVRDQMVKSQRNYYLQEQLKVIRDELGEDDPYNNESKELIERIEKAKLPKMAEAKAMEEYKRFERIPAMSPESGVVRTYLEWMTDVPWFKETKDEYNISKVQKILDQDHFGLKKPKERIVEYIATLKRVKQIKGSILCLMGPPGVGKTSLGKSIARAINREYVRISLGGISDEAEIRGHRRTYIGAMPGKIIQAMKRVATTNPVFLLDEIDKLGSDFRGDPASALLEVLDPEQNSHFIDHYLEVEYDLSKVLFVLTANSRSDIPYALYDRLEVIELPGYHDQEKRQIAQNYIFKKALKNHGLVPNELKISEPALQKIISGYTAEAGVRNLEREINKICRKVVVELSKNNQKKSVQVTKKDLSKYLGEPYYTLNPIISHGEKGVALGLAWTSYGGDVLPIEVNLLPGKEKITLTGNLGDVMQESAQIAITYLRSRAKKYKIDPDFYSKYEIHIHLPEGAIPKEGPSAGITLTTAILSALTNKSFPKNLAMTGEITLRGKVLEIGGLNEKLLAAKRVGIKKVILPEDNRKDMAEIEKDLYTGIELIFVRNYDEIFKTVF
ncbi:MAG: endopeptidase La [Calditrichaeota bacterium]|nr:MAG: endopeptidase La [Calditrichota bacterium]MBL1205041.1 endopeptidase La [Calditrichota bacterium]NOG44871.1 endopeptidase La [Calditrichota bacterium]